MINWIRENAILASMLAGFITVISSGAVAYHQLSNLIAKQPGVDQHIHDSTIHIDPMRDPVLHKQWEERVEKLEGKIERLERQQRWMERRPDGNQGWEGRRRER